MKKLQNVKITFNVSLNDYFNHWVDYDFIQYYNEPTTIYKLINLAHNKLSEYTYGIARLYWNNYQIGTITNNGDEIKEFLTDFGKKLYGKSK